MLPDPNTPLKVFMKTKENIESKGKVIACDVTKRTQDKAEKISTT